MRLLPLLALLGGFLIFSGCRDRGGDDAVATATATSTLASAATATVTATATPGPGATPAPATNTTSTSTFSRQPGTHDLPITVGGLERHFLVHIPEGLENSARVPAVIVLHGGGGNGNQVLRSTRFDDVADENGFIAVFPFGDGRFSDDFLLTWNSGNCCGYARSADIDDVTFIRAVVTAVIDDWGADPARIFATGMSNGGMMSYRLACDASDIFLAVAPVAGALNLDCNPANPVSLLAVHGTADQHVLYDGGPPVENVDPAPRVDTSVAESTGFFVAHDGCQPDPETTMPGAILRYDEWQGCGNGTRVALYTIIGGIHEWPGDPTATVARDIDASRLIWDFFASLPPR